MEIILPAIVEGKVIKGIIDVLQRQGFSVCVSADRRPLSLLRQDKELEFVIVLYAEEVD